MTLLVGFAAVNTGNNLLFLIVSALLAFMSVTGLVGMYNIKNLIPDILPPDEIFAEVPSHFRITVQNSSRVLPSFLIRAEGQTFQSLLFPCIPRGEISIDSVWITFNRRGRHQLGTVTLRSPYPVGFFSRFWRYEIPKTVIVFPRPSAVFSDGVDDGSSVAGFRQNSARGLSGELEKISPYSGSEPLRLIHWKHSARGSDLLVKEFGRSVAAPLIIDLNTLPGTGTEEKISRAAWLVRQWVNVRPVGLLLGTRMIPAGIGRQQCYRLLSELAVYDTD